jgi:hypothetical protein
VRPLLHDLRNLLERALACTALIQEEGGPGVRDAADSIEQACLRAGEILQRISGPEQDGEAHREPGRAPHREQRVDLHGIARGVAALFAPAESKTGIEVTTALRARSSRVRGDAGELFRMLLNLAVNAEEAMPGGGRMEFASEALLRGGKPWLELSLTDSGGGIAPEHLPHIFRGGFSTRGVGRGSGLSIAADIARTHGGAIEASSQPGQGTRLRVLLPLAHEVRIRIEGAEGAALRTQRELLRSLGHEVQRNPFDQADLVVLDDEPPRFSAAQALEKLRGSGLPVVVLSAAGTGGLCETPGSPTRLLRKPCALGELERAIAELVL